MLPLDEQQSNVEKSVNELANKAIARLSYHANVQAIIVVSHSMYSNEYSKKILVFFIEGGFFKDHHN